MEECKELGGNKSKRRAQRDVDGNWSKEYHQSFEALKTRLTNAQVLADYADFSLFFILEVDASHDGLGAVLYQEQGGKVRPIAYASRGLRPTERNMQNYSSIELEFLALKWAVTETFREYLLGSKCVVHTDNNTLSHLSSAKLGATEQCWAAQLASFGFKIKYRSGKKNKNADALSRLHPSGGHNIEAVILGTSLHRPLQQALHLKTVASQAAVTVLPQLAPLDLFALQKADPVIQEVGAFWKEKRRPNFEERKRLFGLVLLRQWEHLIKEDGVL